MAVPARDIRHETPRARRPRLVDASSPGAKSSRPLGRPACVPGGLARQNFRMLAVVVVVLTLLGLGRVWLSVQAAEASIDSYELRRAIKAERYRGDMLEIQQSALSSPSRIRAIAGATMDMTTAGEVTLIDLPQASAPSRAARVPEATTAVERVIADAMGLAAGEAQVLLVGDVGLASAR